MRRFLEPVREFPEYTVVNDYALAQPHHPAAVEHPGDASAELRAVRRRSKLAWTYFGYADDDEDMTRRRLRQANLMGPAGFVSIDDSEVIEILTRPVVSPYPEGAGVMEMGGRDWKDEAAYGHGIRHPRVLTLTIAEVMIF